MDTDDREDMITLVKRERELNRQLEAVRMEIVAKLGRFDQAEMELFHDVLTTAVLRDLRRLQ
jgi:hypothetical protein